MESKNYNFPKYCKLLTKEDFNAAFSNSQRIHNKYLLWVISKNNFEFPRLGIIIAKKNVKLAVQRNRIKRLIRENFRKKRELLKPLDIIVIANKGIDRLSNFEINKALDYQWKKIETL